MNWQLIKTVPRDGTRVLLANDKFFTVGQLNFRIEPDMTYLGYDEGVRHQDGSLKIRSSIH